jgi:hypothetical protein
MYKLSRRAYEQYKINTKSNRDTSYKLARKKLNRNIALGKLVREDDTYATYRYGYLNVTVNKNIGVIVDVHQEFMVDPVDIDKDAYKQYNEEHGIPTDEAVQHAG